jgi:hypothetical protein
MNELLQPYLDQQGRVTEWPPIEEARRYVRDYLAAKIDTKTLYTVEEIDSLLNQWHTFNDAALLRRELSAAGWLQPGLGGKLRRIAYFKR